MNRKHIIMLILGFTFGILFWLFPRMEALAASAFHFLKSEKKENTQTLADEEAAIFHAPMMSTTTMPTVVSIRTQGEKSVKVPILVYHSVRPYYKGESKYQDMYDITPELLESELEYIIKNGYTTITFADVEKHWTSGTSLPAKPVILSFDDGWKNEYEYAFPLLKKHGMKGTFFIYTNPIDHKKPHWVSWDEVVEMDKAGMEIGGHSRTHPVLTKITTDAGLDKEIMGSKKILESHLGHPIYAFAYPFGMKDARVEDAVRRAGYTSARTTLSGVWEDPEHQLDFHGTLSSDRFSDFTRLLNKE